MSVYDSMLTAGEGAARQEGDRFVAEAVKAVEEPLKTEVLGLTAKLSTAETARTEEQAAWSAKEAEYRAEIERLSSGTLPPERPTYGTVGQKTRITTPGVLSGKNIVGWLEVATNEFVLDDFQLDVSTSGTGTVSGIAIDTRYVVMGRMIVSRGAIGSSKPSNLLYGINGGNLILEDLEISSVVDGVNAHSGSFTARRLKIHDVGQYATDPRHSDGSHSDGIAFGNGILDVLLDEVHIDAGEKDAAGSLSGMMLSPGVPRSLHIYRSRFEGGHPAINMAAAAITDVRFVDVLFGGDPAYGGAAIIANAAQTATLKKAGVMTRTTMLDGSPVVFKTGAES